MDTIVQILNTAGRAFVHFALPMLLQSSLLILLLLAVDVLLRRRVRAVFRYWIWMLVLVKLVLPPSLWSPVSVGTWVGDELEVSTAALLEPEPAPPAEAPPVAQPSPAAYILSAPDPVFATDRTARMEDVAPPSPPLADSEPMVARPAGPTLTWQGFVLLLWGMTVMALLLLLLQRAYFVQGLVAQAEPADRRMFDVLEECRAHLGLRRPVALRISPNATSPAVCGLRRPTILIPQSLAPRLQGRDLRAVFLHELAHIRRGDLWVNLAQTLLQIAYFYHPLLWLANAVMRRAREQAVDETVLVAMGETATQYPETLVNVAKLAFRRRPVLSLRLVGVVESKSALSARIKHMLTRPLPRTARLGLLGLFVLVVIAVVLLPMAGAAKESASADSDGPLDIRLVAVCPDSGDEFYDPDGKKIDFPTAPLGGSRGPWNEKEQHRDFVLRMPHVDGQLLFLTPWVRATGAGRLLGGGSALFSPGDGPSTLVISAEFDRTYRGAWSRFSGREVPVRGVDFTLEYFYGSRREAICTFTGPFRIGQAVPADEGRSYQLTPESVAAPSESQIRFRFTTNQPLNRSMSVAVLLYDRQGRRHLVGTQGGGSSSPQGANLTYDEMNGIPWDQIAAVTVGEKPYTATFRNIVVQYPDRPPRAYPPDWDRMAERLGLTGLSLQELGRYRFKNVQEVITVLDVVRSYGPLRKVMQAIEFSQPPVDLGALDEASRDTVRRVAAYWLQSPDVEVRAFGVQLGLMAGLPEFVEPAFVLLDYQHPTYAHQTRDIHHRASASLRRYVDHMTAADIERLKQRALRGDDPGIWGQFVQCLRAGRRPAWSDVLWELAQDERPWVWGPCLAALLERNDKRLRAYSGLSETMKLHLFLASDTPVPGDEALAVQAKALVPELLTLDTVRMFAPSAIGLDYRRMVGKHLGRQEATTVYMSFLRELSQPGARWHFEREHGRFNSLYTLVPALVRDINLWYGVNLGGLGVYEYGNPEHDSLSIRQDSVLAQIIADTLNWYDAGPKPPPRAPVFAGRVVDTAGRGLAGVMLTLKRPAPVVDESGQGNPPDIEVGTLQTDTEGRFEFRDLTNARHHWLHITAPGFTQRDSITVGQLPDGRFYLEQSPRDSVIVMERPARLAGRLLGLDGRPLAHAVLNVSSYPAHAVPRHGQCPADAQGRFVIDSPLLGFHQLRYDVRHQDDTTGDYEGVTAYRFIELQEGQEADDIVLDLRQSTACLEFEIVDDKGQPLGAESVGLNINIPSRKPPYTWVMFLQDVKPQSMHRLGNLPPLEGHLDVTATGRPPRRVPVKLVANETTRCKVEFAGSGDGTEDLAAEMTRMYGKYKATDRLAPVAAPEGPAFVDSDGDGLSDFQETHKYLTDPKKEDSDDDGTPDGDWNERREYAYSVRTVLRYLPPFDGRGLNDDLQDARVLKQSADYVEIEVIHYPLATGYDSLLENPNWRRNNVHDARLAEYLAPGVTTNWDEQMKRDLMAALEKDGIDVETLTDKQVVERVSSWLLKRSRSLDNVFTTYYVDFPQGTPRVSPGLEDAFRREFERDSRNYDWTIEQHFDHELLGKGMFYNKTHGSCTSTAIYLTTVLRALGIPTRMVLVTPAVDGSDRAQVLMVKDAITHNRVRVTMLAGLGWASHGFCNHTFNEVYVGNRWCRLDYTQLGCSSLGERRFGLQTHLYTFNDLSDVNFAPTWGLRYAKGEHSDAFQHDNPYAAVEVSELFGPHGRVSNPPFTAQDLWPNPKPDIFFFAPRGVDVWQEVTGLVASATSNKTSRWHQKEPYENLFSGLWLSRPRDILLLLFSLDTPERVPAGYEDLLPKPWAEIESALRRGETIELGGKAREMNVILLAAPTSSGLKALVPKSELLRAIGGVGPVSSAAPTRPPALPQPAVEPAQLPEGITVELLGVCEYPSEGKPWWRPDGSTLDPAPYQTTNNKRELKEGFRDYELVVRYGGAPEMDIQWDVPGSANTGITGNPYDAGGEPVQDLTVCTLRFPQTQTAMDVRVAAAAGAWETRATHTALEREGSYPLAGGKAVAFGIPYTKNGDTFVPVTTDFFPKDTAFRVVAMQGQNEAHSGGMSGFGDTLNSLTYRFKCPLSEIRELRFQTRPWTWVEFRNVALRPGLRTEARVAELSGAQANRPGRRPPGEEKVFGLGPAWEVLKAAVGDHYGGTIGGFGSDATQRKQYFDEMFSLTHPGDVFVLMLAFDQPAGVPPEYMDLLPLSWAQIESRVRAGESVEAQGQARDLTMLILAAPTSGQLDTLVRQTRLLDPFRSSPSPPAPSPQEPVNGWRRVVLPEADQWPVILDLATGELVPLPPVGPEPAKLQEALRKLGKGDLLFDQDLGDHTLILWRDATSPQAQEDTGEGSIRGYLIGPQLPETLTITTAEGRRYEIQILAADDKACTLTYSPMPRDESVSGSTPTSSGKGDAAVSPSAAAGSGPVGRHALSFDGVDDRLVVPPSVSLTLKSEFSIEIWLKPDAEAKSYPLMSFMQKGRTPHDPSRVQAGGFLLALSPFSGPQRATGGTLALGREDGGLSQVGLIHGLLLERPGWSYLCARYAGPDYVPMPDQPLLIGDDFVPDSLNLPGQGLPFKGQVAKIRIWNKYLRDAEAQPYGSMLTGYEPNLVASWDFECQAGGQVVSDLTPNHNDAQLGTGPGKDDADPAWVDLSDTAADPGAKQARNASVIDGSSGPTEKTLKQLLKEAQPGAVVTVPRGRYTMPVEITKPVVLRGESQEDCVIEVTADQSAILVNTGGQGEVTIENVTVRWQLATDKPSAQPAALRVKDTNARIRNCRFLPLGDPKRAPTAVYIEGRSKSTVDNCRFNGFEYTVCYGQGTEGVVQDCIITDCGHQGVINYDGATLTVQRCVITGSKFHAVRCTGGTLHVKDNLLIDNVNRGIYLGNKTGRGTITNNVILGNGTGISGFGRADYVIANNVVVDNSYAGIDMRDSCRLTIRDNVLVNNQRGVKLFKEGAENSNVLAGNTYWSNAADMEDIEEREGTVKADPQFADPNHGDFSVRARALERHGLTEPQVIQELWRKYEQAQRERSATPTQPARDVRQTPSQPAPPAEAAGSKPATQAQDVLKRLMDEARPGGVVTVPKGRYTTPVEIAKPVVLRGESQEGCIIEVTADQPAVLINTGGQGEVAIENMTVQWQLATDKRIERPTALLVKDTNVRIRNCRFLPLGDYRRCPTAVYIDGRSNSTVDNCRFGGFEYAVCYGPNTQGVVQDCIITDCGHQGVINYDGSTLSVQRCVITGSKFHAVRCTGGTLHVKDNLLIHNANRGIYLGNQTGRGTIVNNVILGNGTGISGFGRADYVIANNVVVDNSYAGIDMRDSCRLSIRDNILARNQRGLMLHKEGAENFNTVGKNAYWANATDVENLDKPQGSLTADPQFADPNHGDFTGRGPAREQGQGLTNPQVIRQLWAKYEQLQREQPAQPAARTESTSASSQAPSVGAGTSTPSPAPAQGPGPIQQRINDAAPGATIRLEPGMYKESLLINKPLTLEGAGWDKTVIIKERMAVKAPKDIERLMAERVAAAQDDTQRQEIMAQMKKEFTERMSPLVLAVENAQGVVIRGIKFTSPGGTIKGGSMNVPLLQFDHSRVRLSDCAIIAGPGDGIHILNGSGAQIEKTLVAAVWGTGIMMGPGPGESGVRIYDCDIRNCHYAGMGIRKDASNTVVERCRISGAAWHGIRYDDAAPQILGNLLFGHARFGIYASGQTAATVRGNLFYANEMTGMACWFQNKDLIEGNTFVDNKEANLAILGSSKPDIRRNIFYGGPVGVSLGNIGADSPFAKSEGIVALQGNLFWRTDHELQLRREANTTEILPVGADTGTVRIDPGFTAAASRDFSLRADSPARAKNIGAGDLLAFDSPWPLQPEELAIIPKGDTRDSRQWRQPN